MTESTRSSPPADVGSARHDVAGTTGPVSRRLAEALVYVAPRDLVLLLFMFSTYPVASVVGFGRLLAVMGLAQTRDYLNVERTVYLGCFLLLPLLEFPFARFIRTVFG